MRPLISHFPKTKKPDKVSAAAAAVLKTSAELAQRAGVQQRQLAVTQWLGLNPACKTFPLRRSMFNLCGACHLKWQPGYVYPNLS
jgi:hypothetical protein